ncbi:LEAF RUST 10 DISEASE-RESISTANCE LOCUS RECEPTOR-LIKE PROTEIN KINASE-like 1.2 [Juglans microcarpa x Juglans regia]|uniref:LEAF RUST 10 DISEASE-RESISTANCE LOCUS RECEPTOR-LIKE PROTEIN KINASE-like 1.2 n=1 Tax=Juglans microcarpa x Juglans regia TaxID=2249226 RepID=UPI001B7E1890|nr:LEAF RUST 10 DISEASE-RESISTANCE LOCUS RECEPTOR-LIKE PROTEIN KINASE-like 1.2 [Juglans microcarpa x Juglans regia]
MKPKNLFPTIFPLLNLCIFLILSSPLPRKSQGVVDPYFLVCSAEPDNCGDGQPIKYPFHIRSKQNRSCGYPGFELSCNNNGQPTINIQSNDYIIHNIFYETEILRVSNSDFWNSTTGCIPLTQSISLPSARFELAPFQTHVNLLYGCNTSTLESTLRFSAYPDCDHGENKNRSVLVLAENDQKLRNVSEACTTRVVVPVEPYEREKRDGIERALRNGFWVKWKASTCSICQESGGWCGFNYTDRHFKCFCPDRPYAWNCISANRHLTQQSVDWQGNDEPYEMGVSLPAISSDRLGEPNDHDNIHHFFFTLSYLQVNTLSFRSHHQHATRFGATHMIER